MIPYEPHLRGVANVLTVNYVYIYKNQPPSNFNLSYPFSEGFSTSPASYLKTTYHHAQSLIIPAFELIQARVVNIPQGRLLRPLVDTTEIMKLIKTSSNSTGLGVLVRGHLPTRPHRHFHQYLPKLGGSQRTGIHRITTRSFE